ncbi:hypothetical protein [Falsarthrobacter nasiphocae]|uniref:Repeat protein (TIGR01451 family) n=1 Tax=Falsarthrobacter nasiphocae TaxID=189863 RepID=A0AAE4C8Z4_9MICC|nr:hypothetical protein [Falsarthrobacter nasiphocae]MDR6892900.1 putative repeat protein (TIGR01451 family) [Falsarthrobacter nasiphocae]
MSPGPGAESAHRAPAPSSSQSAPGTQAEGEKGDDAAARLSGPNVTHGRTKDGHLQEASAEWLGIKPGATVKNNQLVQINLKINANNADGSATARPTRMSVQLKNGRFPDDVKQISGVTVSADGREATVDFGQVAGGTTKQLALDVQPNGENGTMLTAKVTPNVASKIELPGLRVSATHDVQVSTEPHESLHAMADSTPKHKMWFPFMMTVPVDGVPLGDKAEFDLVVRSDEADFFENLSVTRWDANGVPLPGVTVTKNAATKSFHVVLTGLKPPKPPALRLGPNGEKVTPDRLPVVKMVFYPELNNGARGAQRNKPYKYTMTIENLDVRTSANTAITTDSPGDNVRTFHGRHSRGTVQTDILRWTVPELLSEEENAGMRNRAGHGPFLHAQPGDKFLVQTTSFINHPLTPKNQSAFLQTTHFLTVDPGFTRFAGNKVGVRTLGGDTRFYDRNNLPSFIRWSTDPLPPHDGDLRTLNYTRGGSMPENATVIAWDNSREQYASATNVPDDPRGRSDQFFVPIEVLPDNITADFDGNVFQFSAFSVGDNSYHPISAGGDPRAYLPVPSKRYPNVTRRNTRVDAISAAPFSTESATSVDAKRLATGESATLVLTDASTSRHPNLAPYRNQPHTLESTVTLPATLRLEREGLPADAKVTQNEDGTTTLVYRRSTQTNERAETRVKVTALANGSVARIRHETRDVSEFVKRSFDWAYAESVYGLALAASNETLLSKTAVAPEMSFNGSNAWIIEEENKTSTQAGRVAVVDILPYAGDGNGTRYRGRVHYTEPVAASPGVKVYYSRQKPETISKDPADPKNLGPNLDTPGEGWVTDKPDGGYTAVMLVSEGQAPGARLTARIPFSTEGNLPEDRYANAAWSRSGVGGENTDLRMIRSATAISPKEAAKLQVHKKLVEGQQLRAGATVRYAIDVHNAGSTPAEDVLVRDPGGNGVEPGSVRFLEPPKGTHIAGDEWRVGVLGAGETKRILVEVRISDTAAGGRVGNVVTIENPRHPRPEGPETCVPNVDVLSDTDGCHVTDDEVPEPALLRIDKESAGQPGEDGLVPFRLTVKNASSREATNVVIKDYGGEGLDASSLVFESVPDGTRTEGPHWLIPSLRSGETRSVTVKLRRAADQGEKTSTVRNTATAWEKDPSTPDLRDPNEAKAKDPTRLCQVNNGIDADTDSCDTFAVDLTPPNGPDEKPAGVLPRLFGTGHAGQGRPEPSLLPLAGLAAAVGAVGALAGWTQRKRRNASR